MVYCGNSSDRRNGLSWPTNILQVLAIGVLISFTAIHFVLVFQFLPGALFPVVLTISILVSGATVASKVLCTALDPADKALRKDPKSTYGGVKKLFDRAKQGHVITIDSFCQICETTVGLSSRHCSQCNKCIVRFDHHCDYINNCVGQLNYTYYIVLLISASLYSLTVLSNLCYIIYQLSFNELSFLASLDYESDTTTIFGYEVSASILIATLVILLVLALIFFCLLVNLLRLHLYLMYHGWTTWDYYCRPPAERIMHSYWKYQTETIKEEQSAGESSQTQIELKKNGPTDRHFCNIRHENKTSPMPPHSV